MGGHYTLIVILEIPEMKKKRILQIPEMRNAAVPDVLMNFY